MSIDSIKSHFDRYQQNPHTRETNFKFEIDTTNITNLLANKDYDIIVKNPDLFLTVFAKALASSMHEVKKLPSLVFNITEKTTSLALKGDYLFADPVVKIVEKLRTLFEATMYKGRVTVLPVPCLDKRIYLMQPFNLSVDLRDIDPSFTHSSEAYENYVKPSLKRLSELLGGTYSEKKEYQVLHGNQVPHIAGFHIDWTAEEHYESHVAPIVIPEREGLQMHLYRMYTDEKQPGCDLTIVSQDMKEIKIHESVLRCFGGPILPIMLDGQWKESNEKKVVFGETPSDVLKVFVEYLYLGESALRPKVFLQKKVDVCTLLDLAVAYQIDPLIKCCVNILSIGATVEQVDEVKALAEAYNRLELKPLAEHLTYLIAAKKLGME